MIYTLVILICAAGTPHRDCTEPVAIDVIRPAGLTFPSVSACQRFGLMSLAGSGLLKDRPGRPKILCPAVTSQKPVG